VHASIVHGHPQRITVQGQNQPIPPMEFPEEPAQGIPAPLRACARHGLWRRSTQIGQGQGGDTANRHRRSALKESASLDTAMAIIVV